jgi:Kinesin motor domain
MSAPAGHTGVHVCIARQYAMCLHQCQHFIWPAAGPSGLQVLMVLTPVAQRADGHGGRRLAPQRRRHPRLPAADRPRGCGDSEPMTRSIPELHAHRTAGRSSMARTPARHSQYSVMSGPSAVSGGVRIRVTGSERVSRSEASGERLKEAQHINRSLSALGSVMAVSAFAPVSTGPPSNR